LDKDTREDDRILDRLWWSLTRVRVRTAFLRWRRPNEALTRLRPIAARHPADVELRLHLAELELCAGELERAITEAGIAIQLAPGDVRGMSLLLQAQARIDAGAGAADTSRMAE
jgi:Flp pilus assembly protein TadD